MSDAELLELYAIYFDAFAANMALVITLVFAYLIASYVSAQKLNAFQFYATSALFTIFTFSVVMGAHDISKRAASLQLENVRRITEDGSSISYVAAAGMPEYLPQYILGVCSIAIVLAVVFAISQRRRDT